MVLVAVQHIADLVQVVTVERAVPDHAREGLLIGNIGAGRAAFALGILGHDGHHHVLEGAAGEQAVVAFQIELQPADVQPVHDAAALVGGDELVHHHRAVRLHIAAVAANVAVNANVPDLLLVLGLAAAAAQIDFVAVGPRFADGLHSRGGQPVLVIHQGAVNVDQQDLAHRFLPPVGCFFSRIPEFARRVLSHFRPVDAKKSSAGRKAAAAVRPAGGPVDIGCQNEFFHKNPSADRLRAVKVGHFVLLW